MIDEHCLLFEPIRPALGADLVDDAGSNRPRKGRLYKSRSRLATTRAAYGLRHARIYLRA